MISTCIPEAIFMTFCIRKAILHNNFLRLWQNYCKNYYFAGHWFPFARFSTTHATVPFFFSLIFSEIQNKNLNMYMHAICMLLVTEDFKLFIFSLIDDSLFFLRSLNSFFLVSLLSINSSFFLFAISTSCILHTAFFLLAIKDHTQCLYCPSLISHFLRKLCNGCQYLSIRQLVNHCQWRCAIQYLNYDFHLFLRRRLSIDDHHFY